MYTIQQNFNKGELTPKMHARDDVAHWKGALANASNFVTTRQGAMRRRAGFVPSTRRRREADGVVQREVELADGHGEYRFSGYVTVAGVDRKHLEVACAEVEQAARRAHLELRRLYGRQAEALTWTLPLGRGLS